MNYLSVCSGIEAATVAWHPLGWEPIAFSEIEKFPSAVLAHHWPDVPNLGDMTRHNDWRSIPKPDLIVGGTPCQAFSVAGLREGLRDPRGNLTLTFLAMVDRFEPAWVVWENVPGVLSDKTNAFGQFLAGLGQLGYKYAYRVLDAQHFGVPQRRRRVFVVANSTGVHPGAVLFESESLCGDLTPSREEREEVAPTLSARTRGGGGIGTDFEVGGGLVPHVANPLTARMNKGVNTTCDEGQTMIPTLEQEPAANGGGQVAVAFEPRCARNGRGMPSDVVPPLKAESGTTGKGDAAPCVAFDFFQGGSQQDQVATREGIVGALAHSSNAHGGHHQPKLFEGSQVRRLTVTECERLQGFPDGHTLIPWRGKEPEACPDGPRYKALGNSMAVPVMRWIGERIDNFKSTELSQNSEENIQRSRRKVERVKGIESSFSTSGRSPTL